MQRLATITFLESQEPSTLVRRVGDTKVTFNEGNGTLSVRGPDRTMAKAVACEKVTELRCIISRRGDKFIVLLDSGREQCHFYDIDTLEHVKTFDNVRTVEMNDYWQCGSDQVKLVFLDSTDLITDLGPNRSEVKADPSSVDVTFSALEKQLNNVRGAMEDAYQETIELDDLVRKHFLHCTSTVLYITSSTNPQQIDVVCDDINCISRPSVSEASLAEQVLGSDRVAKGSEKPKRPHFLPDLMTTWVDSPPLIVDNRIVLSLTVTNVSSFEISDLRVLPSVDGTGSLPLVASTSSGQNRLRPNVSFYLHFGLDVGDVIREASTNHDGFELGAVIAYRKKNETGERFHAVSEIDLGSLAALEGNVSGEVDISALKAMLSAKRIIIR